MDVASYKAGKNCGYHSQEGTDQTLFGKKWCELIFHNMRLSLPKRTKKKNQ